MMKPSPHILHGLRDGIPIALGYYAVAFSLGIIAKSAGVTALLGFICSAFTRASAGEYAVYTLAAIGATYAEVVTISIIANLRYLLMSTALTQKFAEDTPLWKRILLACCITDEVFGISIAYPGKLKPSYTFSAAAISTLFWASGTASGIIAGNVLPANIVTALSVSLYGMFLAIIIPPAKKDRAVGVAIIASFFFSWLFSQQPLCDYINTGTKTILLTIVISALAAVIKPIKDEK
ncbi:MAG: AzlC family ABC transporter permease [Prevotella sp.]|nr:AzlC family ABC transporter permease [Candidatus Prevotella equi]